MRKFTLFSLFLALLPLHLISQVLGGKHAFPFLKLSPSARITGLGGEQIAVKDDDPVFALTNPAALNPAMHRHATFNHNFFLSDIQHGYAGYAHYVPKIGFTLHGGIQYLDYGDIKRADEYGNVSGEIRARETAITLGGAKALSDKLSLGLNLRWINAGLDVFSANGLGADAGLMYADTSKRFTIALVVRNAGIQFDPFHETAQDMPTDVQLAFSRRLAHLPFRFTILAHHLNQWNIRYDDPNLVTEEILFIDDEDNQDKGNPEIDNFFRHLVFSGEFLLGKNESFRLRFGYNHLRKRELTVLSYRSLAGFTGGVGVKIKRFRIDMGFATYHLAGGVVHMGVGTAF